MCDTQARRPQDSSSDPQNPYKDPWEDEREEM